MFLKEGNECCHKHGKGLTLGEHATQPVLHCALFYIFFHVLEVCVNTFAG